MARNYNELNSVRVLSRNQLFTQAEIDESHGISHALTVLAHTDSALASTNRTISSSRALSVRLAALLHDADDHKFFPSTSESYINAITIMEGANAGSIGDSVISDAVNMISLVSCSSNGNSLPEQAVAEPEILWPRWADRLEATGEIGVIRWYQVNCKYGDPIAVETTPRPKTAEEALELATEERFESYQARKGSSNSMIDHYYDKLLQVSRPDPKMVQNAYLEEQALQRVQPLLQVCLTYTEQGAEGVTKLVDELALKFA